MGNRSSSHYPPPPHWMHQRTSYSTSASPYPEAKRPIAPGAFAEPYLPNTPNKQQMRRSVISLNATDGFHNPQNPNRGSRISLNQMDFDFGPPPGPRLIIPPDAKTLKKLEKMEKKHQKLLKKLGARGIPLPMPPPPPPQMHPMFTRTMSFDDLNRAHHNHPNLDPDFNGVRMRQRRPDADEWRSPQRREMNSQYIKQQNHHNFSSNSTRRTGGSLASSSPMTSSEEGGHSTDPWNSSSISSGRGGEPPRHHVMSPPMYSSTPHEIPQTQPISKTIEVKVERTEKIEQTTSDQKQQQQLHQQQQQPTHQIHNGNMYAQPIIRGQPSYGSRTSSVTNSLLKCDQSEIDFSWVNEEEDKLNQEDSRNKSNHLPEFYFGMDPPPVLNEETKENDMSKRRSVLEKTAAFEVEARRSDRKEPPFLSRSSHHLPHPDYSPLQIHTKEVSGGPAERRIYRLQNQAKTQDDRRYRSSIAF